jgi:hypothetical protein
MGVSLRSNIHEVVLTDFRTYEDQIIDFIDYFVKNEIGAPVQWDPATSSFIIMFGINDVVSISPSPRSGNKTNSQSHLVVGTPIRRGRPRLIGSEATVVSTEASSQSKKPVKP